MTAVATTSERLPLSRDVIAEAALVVVDRDGLGGLTMRKLAAELRVEAPSLYNHVRGKEDVLDLVAVHVMNKAPMLSSRGRTPRTRIRDMVLAYREAMLEHPNVFTLLTHMRSEPTDLMNSANAVLAELRAGGLSERAARVRYVQCAAYINGWIAQEIASQSAVVPSTFDLPVLDGQAFLSGLDLLLP